MFVRPMAQSFALVTPCKILAIRKGRVSLKTPGPFSLDSIDFLGDRLTVGCLALNEKMLVRFQLPELDWLGRQLDDHPLSKRGMLRVRLPPEPLTSSWACGVAATLSTWRSRVRIPPRILIVVSAGHWRASEAVTLPPSGCAGSTPAQHTEQRPRGLAEWPPVFQAGDRGFKSRRGY